MTPPSLTAGGVGIWVLVFGFFGVLVKAWPALRKIGADREANLLNERAEEMETMRAEIKELRAELTKQLRDRETERNADRAEREADRAIARHEIRNLQSCLDAFFLLVEKHPADAAEHAATVRAMRAEQMKSEAQEKATIRAAKIKGGAE